jgi:hypothetical protein
MNRRNWIKLATLTVLAAISGFSTLAAAPEASPVQRLIRVGETRKYDLGMKVKFLRVTKDKRCPLDDECKNPGDATVVLRIKVGKNRGKIYQLHTNRRRQKLWILLDPKDRKRKRYYRISINSLSPLPFPGKVTPPENFRLDLDVALKH